MEKFRHYCLTFLVWLRLVSRPDFIVRLVDDHPDPNLLQPGTVYVVGGPGFQKWAYFSSPSGSGELMQLSLQRNRRPNWRVTRDFLGRATIHPSVRQLAQPYEHYWIKGGAVMWCSDSGKRPFGTIEHEDGAQG